MSLEIGTYTSIFQCLQVVFPGPLQISEQSFKLLNPYDFPTMGLSLSFFDVGIVVNLLSTPITYYLIYYLDVSSTDYSAFETLVKLPWCLKLFFGMISDGVPICGYRRKSWIYVGWGLYVAISFYMYTKSMPGLTLITTTMFFMTCGYLFAEVSSDSLCVERTRIEIFKRKGSLQTSVYTVKYFGGIIGAILGALLYNTSDWGWGLTISQLFLLSALIPLMGVFPGLWFLREVSSAQELPTVWDQLQTIFQILSLDATWRVFFFLFPYLVLHVPNSALTNYYIIGLNFSDFEIGMLTLAGAATVWAGLVAYRTFCFEFSWRMLFVVTTIVNAIFSLMQLLVIYQLNTTIGLSNFAAEMLLSVATTFSAALRIMPALVIFNFLSPRGREASTFAMLSTIDSAAAALSSDLGSAFTLIWSVDNTAFESGDYTGLVNLTILTSLVQLVPLLLVSYLPDSKEDLQAIISIGKSDWQNGFVLVTLAVTSLLLTIALNVYFVWFD